MTSSGQRPASAGFIGKSSELVTLSGGPPEAAKYSIATGESPERLMASSAAARYSFRSSLVEEMKTEQVMEEIVASQ
ncbi:MAG: hypothetical protein NTZ56_05585 [Acidobacteria bacterium]|nr:hypothetical protein [Acidobacteriota bacterium]